MKITEDYNDSQNSCLMIKEVKHRGNLSLDLTFNDGAEKSVNFEPFLSHSNHPEIKKYLDLNLFLNFKIIDGNLNWNDYDLIFPIFDLYKGQI